MTYCNKCGAENPDDSSFCNKCGAKIIVVEPEVEKIEPAVKEVQSTPTHGTSKSSGNKLAVIGVVALLLAGCLVAFMAFGNGIGDDDGPDYKMPFGGTYTLVAPDSLSRDRETVYSGNVVITMEKGVLSISKNITKTDYDNYTGNSAKIYHTEEYDRGYWPYTYYLYQDVKSKYAFIQDYDITYIEATFSDGHSYINTCKFISPDGEYAIYVSIDGKIYQLSQHVDRENVNFYLDGWTRTTNDYGSYFD